MSADLRERSQAYIAARHQHAAWQLLAAHRAPLVLSCLQNLLFDTGQDVRFEDALQKLAGLLAEHANDAEFGVEGDDFLTQARKELRSWIRRELIVERNGILFPTDALESALKFVEGLENRILTSTGSRLSLVQSGIESLDEKLNPDPQFRASQIRRRIEDLQHQLAAVEAGHVEVLSDADAVERIRDIYRLTSDLKADFRRVEESWRQQGMRLRQDVVNAQNNRGEVVDRLLTSNRELLDTPEGRAFDGFYSQLHRQVELANMRERLKSILRHPAASQALTPRQREDLRWLVNNLVRESASVLQARRNIERDVRGYLRTGLAAEHHRVGALLTQIFSAAHKLEWTRDQRKTPSPFPPVGERISNLPLIQRLLFKLPNQDELRNLDMHRQYGDLSGLPYEFWSGMDSLDRQDLVERTRELLTRQQRPFGIADLAAELHPQHDLEAVALWVGLAMAVHAPISAERESFDLETDEDRIRFDVPKVTLTTEVLGDFEGDI